MTPTPEEVAALVKLLHRPYGNLTGSERADTAAALTALQARAEAAEARVRELEAANKRAWEAGRDAARQQVESIKATYADPEDRVSAAAYVCCDMLSELIAAITPPSAPSAPAA